MMVFLESYVENLVNKVCGRWLEAFSREQLQLNLVEGSVVLKNVVIRTQELEELCLPFTPRRLFIGRITVHIQTGLSYHTVKVQASDCLALLRCQAADSHFFCVRQALQSYLHILQNLLEHQFRAIAASTSVLADFLGSPSAKSTVQTLQTSEVVLSNVHVRVEDTTVDTIPVPLALGVVIASVSIGPSADAKAQGDVEDGLLLDKQLVIESVGVYLDNETVLSLRTEEEVIARMRSFSLAPEAFVALPTTFKARILYRLLHNRCDVEVRGDGISLRCANDVVHLLLSWLRIWSSHLRLLQRNTLRSGNSVVNPAAQRWKLAIGCVLNDLRTFRDDLRSYFRTWVLASRYSTIRALLYDYIHVVTFKDAAGTKQQRFYENLRPVCLPSSDKTGERERQRFEAEYTSYMLPYELPPEIIKAARDLVRRHTNCNFTGLGLSHNVNLEPRMVQALYALQLELDAALPPTVAAFLRLDVAHRIKSLEILGPLHADKETLSTPTDYVNTIDSCSTGGNNQAADSVNGLRQQVSSLRARLLVALADCEGLKPLVPGSSSVDAFCRITLSEDYGSKGRKRIVESGICKYDINSSVARWNAMFQFDLPPEIASSWVQEREGSEGGTATTAEGGDAVLLQIECLARLVFVEVSFGTVTLTRADVLSVKNEVVEHTCALESAKQPAELKILTLCALTKRGGEDGRAVEAKLKRQLSSTQRRRSGDKDLIEHLSVDSAAIPQQSHASLIRRGSSGGATPGGSCSSSSSCLERSNSTVKVGAAAGATASSSAFPAAMLWPTVVFNLKLGNMDTRVEMAHYAASASEVSRPRNGPGRSPVTAREVLLNVITRGMSVGLKVSPQLQSDSATVAMNVDVALQSLEIFSGPNASCQPSDTAVVDEPLEHGAGWRPMVTTSGFQAALGLNFTKPQSLITAPRLLSWALTLAVEPYRFRILPLRHAVEDPDKKVLWRSAAFFPHVDAVVQVLEGSTPDTGLAGMLRKYLSLQTTEQSIQFDYVYAASEATDGRLSAGCQVTFDVEEEKKKSTAGSLMDAVVGDDYVTADPSAQSATGHRGRACSASDDTRVRLPQRPETLSNRLDSVLSSTRWESVTSLTKSRSASSQRMHVEVEAGSGQYQKKQEHHVRPQVDVDVEKRKLERLVESLKSEVNSWRSKALELQSELESARTHIQCLQARGDTDVVEGHAEGKTVVGEAAVTVLDYWGTGS